MNFPNWLSFLRTVNPEQTYYKPKEAVMNLTITAEYVEVKDTRTLTAKERRQWAKLWPNFPPHELDTRDYSLRMTRRSLDAVQATRDEFGDIMYPTCACRNWAHNKAVGGKDESDHLTEDERGNPLYATAFDIAIANSAEGRKLEAIARKHGFNAIGRYPVSRFIHISMREPKPNGAIYQWGSWYSPRKVKHV